MGFGAIWSSGEVIHSDSLVYGAVREYTRPFGHDVGLYEAILAQCGTILGLYWTLRGYSGII